MELWKDSDVENKECLLQGEITVVSATYDEYAGDTPPYHIARSIYYMIHQWGATRVQYTLDMFKFKATWM